MIVVADAGPLQYLVRIAAIDVLAPYTSGYSSHTALPANCSRTTHRLRSALGSCSRPPGVRFAPTRLPILLLRFSIRASALPFPSP